MFIICSFGYLECKTVYIEGVHSNWTELSAIRKDKNKNIYRFFVLFRNPESKSLTQYYFFSDTNAVLKMDSLQKRRYHDHYRIVYDSTVQYNFTKKDSSDLKKEIISDSLIKLTQMDSTAFAIVNRESDSMGLKNFHYLSNAIGFRLISKK